MYLESLLPSAEYVKFKYDMIPPRIVKYYNLDAITVDGYVYAKIKKAWYGLKQARKIAHNNLVTHLKQYQYICKDKTAP